MSEKEKRFYVIFTLAHTQGVFGLMQAVPIDW